MLNERARILRKNSTDAEIRMWYFLRDRRLDGFKFKRQFIIEPYIVDFICREKKLIIELDGTHHLEQVEYDNDRTDYLANLGYRVLRFWNNQVLTETESVLECILEFLRPSP